MYGIRDRQSCLAHVRNASRRTGAGRESDYLLARVRGDFPEKPQLYPFLLRALTLAAWDIFDHFLVPLSALRLAAVRWAFVVLRRIGMLHALRHIYYLSLLRGLCGLAQNPM